MEEEVKKAKVDADAAMQVSEGPTSPEPVAPINVQLNNALVAPTTLDTCNTWEEELSNLREELKAQEALRAREREQKEATKEEKRKIEDVERQAQLDSDRLYKPEPDRHPEG